MNNEAESLQSPPEAPQKRRSQAQKVGRLKYIISLQKRILARIEDIEKRQRWLLAWYNDFVNLSEDYVFKAACKDRLDKAILTELRTSPDKGLLPSELSERLAQYNISRQMITYRIQQMNKRLMKDVGQPIAEKRGHHWALTSVLKRIQENAHP